MIYVFHVTLVGLHFEKLCAKYTGLHLCGEGFIVEQDNDPKHSSSFAKAT